MKTFCWSFLLAFVAFACQMQDDPTPLADDASSKAPTPGAYVVSTTASADGKTITMVVDQSAAQATSNMLFKVFACDGTPLSVANVTSFTINGVDKMDKLNSSVGAGTACATVYTNPYIHLQQSIQPDIFTIVMEVDTPTKSGSFVIKSTNDCWGVNDAAYSFTRDCTPPPTCYETESAWASGTRYVTRGNWATYTTYVPGGNTVNVYAGQNKLAGRATFSAVNNGKVTITITMDQYWSLQNVSNPVKIQEYNAIPAAGNPSPGRFSSKGSSLTVVMPAAPYYGIHLDVQQAVTCPQ